MLSYMKMQKVFKVYKNVFASVTDIVAFLDYDTSMLKA